MDITNINLGACPLQYLSIGYVGETGARPVAFDFSAWAEEYGAGVLQLLLLRPGDAEPYPVVLDIDGTTATWTPDATATEKTGQGQAQLVYTVGGVIVKNAIFRVLIAPSLGAAGDPPEPYEDWLEQLTELAAETQQNALDAAESAEAAGTSAGAAEEAVTHYPVIINGYWCVWNVTSGEYVSTGIKAQGPDGFSPTVVVTTITGGHRVTITDANGPHVFDVLDGEKGDKGDPLTYDDLTPAQKADLLQDTVTKESLDDAGIKSRTYTPKFDGAFSVTTAASADYIKPHARATVHGRFDKAKLHRVTVNGTEYVLRTRLWYAEHKLYEYLGNLGLYVSDVSGVPGGTDNVPFVIISDLNDASSIDVLTDTAGTYTILVEAITPSQVVLPKSLIWDDAYVPIEKATNSGTYNGFSIGVNELTSKRGTMAFGYGNKIAGEFSAALGFENEVSSPHGIAIGQLNTVSGSFAFAEGYQATASGTLSHAEGQGTTSSGGRSHAEGRETTASGAYSHAEGNGTTASGAVSHAEGYGSVVSGAYAHGEGVQTVSGAQGAHAENLYTIASGNNSHAEGNSARAQASTSHVQGAGTLAGVADVATHVMGVNNAVEEYTGRSVSVQPYNADGTKKGDPGTLQLGKYAEIVGNGVSDDERSNARTMDWDGNETLAGDLTIHAGGTDETTVGEALDEIGAALDEKAPAIYKTVGPAAVVTVTDGAEDMPIKTLTVDIEPVQDLHGYDSPWPAGGGKNKLDYTVAWGGVPYNAAVGTVFTLVETVSQPTVSGNTVTFTTTSGWAGRAWKTPILASGSYTVHLDVSQTSNSRMSIYTVDGTTNAVKTAYASTSSSVFSRTVSVDDGDYIIVSEASSTAGTITVTNMQVESGVSYTAWTTYSNICPISGWDAVSIWNKPTHDTGADPTVTIQLGQTVYGGTLDVAAGTLMVDRWYLTKANASQVKYYFTATPPRVEMLFEGGKFANADSQVNAFSSMYQSTTGVQNKRMRLYRTEIDIYDTDFTDQTATDAILADFIAVYKLSTPITIDLDPVTVSTILGTNNIWADTGDVTAVYSADTKSYIDAQTAALSVEIDALEAAQPKTVTVTGTTPVIAAADNTRYVCGEVATLDITLPASGIVDVVFESGSTPTVLTVTPPTGVTLKWANGFDPDSLETNTVYEVNIADGLGVAASWT